MLRLIPRKKGFTSVSLLTFTKKLGRSSYDFTMTYYDVLSILFLFRFVANVQALLWDSFLVLTMNRRGVTRIYLPQEKNDRPGLDGPKITQV